MECARCDAEFDSSRVDDSLFGPLSIHLRREEFADFCDACVLQLTLEDLGEHKLSGDRKAVLIDSLSDAIETLAWYARSSSWEKAEYGWREALTMKTLGGHHHAERVLSGNEGARTAPGWTWARAVLDRIFEPMVESPERFEEIARRYWDDTDGSHD